MKATLPEEVHTAAEARAMETHLELAEHQQREGKLSNSVVLSAAKTMAPASWWAMYGKHVPKLASVARRVLVQNVS